MTDLGSLTNHELMARLRAAKSAEFSAMMHDYGHSTGEIRAARDSKREVQAEMNRRGYHHEFEVR